MGGNRFQRWIHGKALVVMPFLFIVSLAVVLALNPVKLGLLVWGLCKISLGATVGHLIDWTLFPDHEPASQVGPAAGNAFTRRATIVAACIIAAGLIP